MYPKGVGLSVTKTPKNALSFLDCWLVELPLFKNGLNFVVNKSNTASSLVYPKCYMHA